VPAGSGTASRPRRHRSPSPVRGNDPAGGSARISPVGFSRSRSRSPVLPGLFRLARVRSTTPAGDEARGSHEARTRSPHRGRSTYARIAHRDRAVKRTAYSRCAPSASRRQRRPASSLRACTEDMRETRVPIRPRGSRTPEKISIDTNENNQELAETVILRVTLSPFRTDTTLLRVLGL